MDLSVICSLTEFSKACLAWKIHLFKINQILFLSIWVTATSCNQMFFWDIWSKKWMWYTETNYFQLGQTHSKNRATWKECPEYNDCCLMVPLGFYCFGKLGVCEKRQNIRLQQNQINTLHCGFTLYFPTVSGGKWIFLLYSSQFLFSSFWSLRLIKNAI